MQPAPVEELDGEDGSGKAAWAHLARSGHHRQPQYLLSIPSTRRQGVSSLPAFAGDRPRASLRWGGAGNLD